MSGYTKLFSSIIHSTVWRTPIHVRMVWITVLAMKDGAGEVMSSVPGLADAARVSREQVEDALQALMSPDPDSANQDYEGRRLLAIEGGWYVVSHEKYSKLLSKEEQREKWAEKKRRQRSGGQSPVVPVVSKIPPIQIQPIPAPDPEIPLGVPLELVTPKTKREPRAKKTLLPEGIQPNDSVQALAKKLRIDLHAEWPAFCDHARAKAVLHADWQAAARTWVRNARKFADRGGR